MSSTSAVCILIIGQHFLDFRKMNEPETFRMQDKDYRGR